MMIKCQTGPYYAPNTGNGTFFEDPSASPKMDPAANPLPERMRPKIMEHFFGQEHLVGPKGALRPLLDSGHMHSMIFWGDPGVGKTSLARLIAGHVEADFLQLSAVASGVADIRKVLERGKKAITAGIRTVLFIDEIHRFNKSQQDALLHAVEEGSVILIGATTENPSFEVISPLLSRCRVYRFRPLTNDDITKLVNYTLENDIVLKETEVDFHPDAFTALVDLSRGDAREALNLLERTVERATHEKLKKISLELVSEVAQQALVRYDKAGDQHYDTISAFIKTVRNSDPNAAVYWLARMLVAGEEPRFIARRLIILASEDIGNANPNALLLAQAAFDAVHKIGMPEARIILSQATTYLASSPKSNAAYKAINEAMDMVSKGIQPAVPLHLRNAVTGLMKAQGYAEDYKYSHDQKNAVSYDMPGLPPELEGHEFYRPTQYGSEAQIFNRLEEIKKLKNQKRDKKTGEKKKK